VWRHKNGLINNICWFIINTFE